MIPQALIHNFLYLLRGAEFTLLLSAGSVAISTVIGLVVALLHVFGGWPIRVLVEIYLFLVRGIPLLILLFAMYYVLPYAGIDLEPMTGGILVIGLYHAAFMSQVFRGAILALPRSQWDAARGLGMRRAAVLQIVIFPQAFRIAAPPFVNTCMQLIKSTSLVSIIGLWELTMAGREVVERTFAPFQIFAGVALIYFCVCFSLASYGRYLEKRLHYAH
ncbi:MAG TPA: amino acid ABC transporter permease [Stellaceae bacterium]|jgi:polar amino acid transport system permease protein|nr:amino acid ABC transporter permease [Stellaceae bacterium]